MNNAIGRLEEDGIVVEMTDKQRYDGFRPGMYSKLLNPTNASRLLTTSDVQLYLLSISSANPPTAEDRSRKRSTVRNTASLINSNFTDVFNSISLSMESNIRQPMEWFT